MFLTLLYQLDITLTFQRITTPTTVDKNDLNKVMSLDCGYEYRCLEVSRLEIVLMQRNDGSY